MINGSVIEADQGGGHAQRDTRGEEEGGAAQPAQVWLEVVSHDVFDPASGYAVRL